jgi:hypothetical protein
LSFVNGAVVLGFVFGRAYARLPGQGGVTKGIVFGVLGWIAMGVAFFPLLGRGLFASQAGHGLMPALFSLVMVLAYTIVMGLAYAALRPEDSTGR